MTPDLLDLLEKEFSDEAVSHLASALGEDEPITRKAVDWTLPAVLGRLVTMASSPTGAGGLFAILHESGLDGRHLGPIAATLASRNATHDLLPLGRRAVSDLFGRHERGLGESLALFSGMRRASAEVLLDLIVPLVMDFVANHTSECGGFNPHALSAVLTEQTEVLQPGATRSHDAPRRWRWLVDVFSWTWPLFVIAAIYLSFWGT